MERQYLIPGWGYINETGNKDYLVPGWGYINESQSSGSVTGTIATTEGADTLAATGAETFSGTIATTEGADVLVASGLSTQNATGTISVTEDADVLSAVGIGGTTGDTHDGFTRKDYEKHLERLRKREKRLEELRSQKQAQRDNLHDQINAIVSPQEEILEVEKPTVVLKTARKELTKVDNQLAGLQDQIAAIQQDLIQYNIQVQMAYRRAEEEAILLLM